MALDLQCVLQRRQRVANRFAESNFVHVEIAERLIERLDLIRLKPKKIILFGWQTGAEQSLLTACYPDAEIISVDSMEALLSLPEDSVQLVVSHLALDWENEPKQILAAFHRLLTPESLLLFSTLGPDTAKELRESFSSVDDYPHTHTLTDMHHIGDALRQLQFDDPVVDMEMLTLAYDNVSELCIDLRNTASTNAEESRRRGLLTPRQWRAMCGNYNAQKIDDYYPFTLEIIYGHAWKVDQSASAAKEVAIPISAVKKGLKK